MDERTKGEMAMDTSRRYLAQTANSSTGVFFYAESQYAAIAGARRFEKLDKHMTSTLGVYDTLGFVKCFIDQARGCMAGERADGKTEKLPYLFSVDEYGNFFDARQGEFKKFDYRAEVLTTEA